MATDTKSPGEKLSVSSTKTLTLKPRAETGVVRQSFSHGRSKAVVVEKVKRRIGPGEGKAPESAPPPAPAPDRAAVPRRGGVVQRGGAPAPGPTPAPPPPPAPKPSGVLLRTLTKEEQDRRAHALGDAKVREAEERKIAEEEAKIRAERDAIERSEREAAEARKRTEEDRRRHDEETKRKADEVAKKRFGGEEEAAKAATAKTITTTTAAPVSRKLHPVDVGLRSEAAILSHLIRRGYAVLLPFGVNQRYDLILDLGDRFLRAQCKTGRLRDGVLAFATRSTRSNRRGIYNRGYKGDADLFLVYCRELDRTYAVPVEDAPDTQMFLRLTPTSNGQYEGVHHAEQYELPG
jgi:hypothetical protein